MGTLHRVVLSLLVTLVVGLAAVSTARAEELHRSEIGLHCVVTAKEGAEALQGCEVTVEDRSPEPTSPTGLMTLQHSITCTLAPTSADTSSCDFTMKTPFGEASFLGEYSGDSNHARSELSVFWTVSSVGQEIKIFPLPWPLYLPAPPKTEYKPSEAPAPKATMSQAGTIPWPRILARPAERTRRHLAQFRFAAGESLECRLDSGPYRACGTAFSHRVSAGEHVLRVRAAGGGPVATFRWRVLPAGRPGPR